MPRLEDATELIELCQSKENTACTLAVTFSPSVSSTSCQVVSECFPAQAYKNTSGTNKRHALQLKHVVMQGQDQLLIFFLHLLS